MAQTLLQMLNVELKPNRLSQSALIVVDAQNEYLTGSIKLFGIDKALQEIKTLLDRARRLGTKIYFIRHKISEDSPIFNPKSDNFQIIDSVKPKANEEIIDKSYPSSFAQTTLKQSLADNAINNLIFTGFMTHACISTSVRQASELGFNSLVVDSACATRDLPDRNGNLIKAEALHKATLSALSDLFALVVPSGSDIPD